MRWAAYCFGALVLLAHQVTVKLSAVIPDWLSLDWPDLGKHALLVGSFALLYRLSLRSAPASGARPPARQGSAGHRTRSGGAGHRARHPEGLFAVLRAIGEAPGAWARTAIVCGGWAALCELSQFRHPYRDFSVIELALNALMPMLVATVFEMLNPVRLRS
jgi:hypothetical protein